MCLVAWHLLKCYNALPVGAWRSLVARFNGVEEVVGSNPAAPTEIRFWRHEDARGVFYVYNIR